MPDPMPIYRPSPIDCPLYQGEIISGLVRIRIKLDSLSTGSATAPIFDTVAHPLAMIVSQDCDLEQDFCSYSEGKTALGQQLPSILFCEVKEADRVMAEPPIVGGEKRKRVRSNQDARYQFLREVTADQDRQGQGQGLSAIAIDFKRYFTILTDEVYFRVSTREVIRRCILVSPYLEHFISRFFYFQSRVALPVEHVPK